MYVDLSSVPGYSQIEDDKADWELFRSEIGLTDAIENSAPNHVEISVIPERFYTAKSSLSGEGGFAKRDLDPGEIVGEAWIGGKRTELGCLVNHSKLPNCAMFFADGNVHLMAITLIGEGEELTTNYRDTMALWRSRGNKFT